MLTPGTTERRLMSSATVVTVGLVTTKKGALLFGFWMTAVTFVEFNTDVFWSCDSAYA